MIRVLLAVVLCALVVGPSVRAADSGEQLRADGMRDYDAGRYDEAIAKLAAAYARSHDRAILYALGQAQRRKGDCRGAIETFDRFIALGPPPAAIGAARFQIARCLEQLGERGASVVAPPSSGGPSSAAPSSVRPAAPDAATTAPSSALSVAAAPRPRRWIADPAGGVLAGVGIAAVVAGAALLGTAELHAAHAGDDLQSYRAAQDVPTLRGAGILVTAAGAVLVIGAVARWAVAGHSPQRGSTVPTTPARPKLPESQSNP